MLKNQVLADQHRLTESSFHRLYSSSLSTIMEEVDELSRPVGLQRQSTFSCLAQLAEQGDENTKMDPSMSALEEDTEEWGFHTMNDQLPTKRRAQQLHLQAKQTLKFRSR
jgi:hypothetical protein